MIEPNNQPSRNTCLREGDSYKPYIRNVVDDPHINFQKIRTLIKVPVCIFCHRRKELVHGTLCSTKDGLQAHVYEEKTIKKK